MWRPICALVVIGLTSGFQVGLEYHYKYNGRLALGIFEMGHQVAAGGIRMDVTVQMAENNIALMKFNNIETGNYHGEHNCDLRQPVAIEYNPLYGETDLLEKPFRVSFDTAGEMYLEVAEAETIWITNLRKSIVNISPLPALWAESQANTDGLVRPTFEVKETLLGGLCTNWYSVTKIPEAEAIFVRRTLAGNFDTDIQNQSTRTSDDATAESHVKVPSISDDLWKVSRTIDYDDCSNVVQLKLNANKEIDNQISRTSVGDYIFRGNKEGLRMERAVVEGTMAVFTGDNQEDHIDAFTNQTLELQAVTLVTTDLKIDFETRRFSSGLYEPTPMLNGRSSHGETLEEKLSGSSDQYKDTFTEIKKMIFTFLDKMHHGGESPLIEPMDAIVELLSLLSHEQIRNIYEELQEKSDLASASGNNEEFIKADQHIYFFQRALVFTGSAPAVKAFLDKMEDDLASEHRTVSHFFTEIVTSLKAPALVPRILDFAMSRSLDKPNEFLSTLVTTAAGSLAGKFCLGADRRNSHGSFMTNIDSECDTDAVVSNFLPFLTEGIQNTSAQTWKKAVYMQALINTGTPKIIDFLQPIILGTEEQDIALRTSAITSLSADLMPQLVFKNVYDLLMPLIENTGEHPEVRNMAFLTLTTWKLSTSWWKRIALLTWREPSLQVSNLISTTIESIVKRDDEMSSTVSQIAYLAKPSEGISLSLSSSIYLQNYLLSEKALKGVNIAWLSSTNSLFPSHVFLTYELQRLRGLSKKTKIDLYQTKMDFFLELMRQYRDMFRYGDEMSGDYNLFSIVNKLTSEVEAFPSGFPMFTELLLKSGEEFIYGKDIAFFGARGPFPFLKDTQRYINTLGISTFQKPIDTTVAYPTDLSFPVVVQYSSQSATQFSSRNLSSPVPEDLPKWMVWSKEFSFQVNQETSVTARAVLPWTVTSVGAGIRSRLNVVLPIALHIPVYVTEPYQVAIRLQLPKNKMTEDLAKWSGLSFKSSWKGTSPFPGYLAFLRGDVSIERPSYSNWNYELTYEADASTTKEATVIFTYVPEYKKRSEVDSELSSIGQESPEPFDYPDYVLENQVPLFRPHMRRDESLPDVNGLEGDRQNIYEKLKHIHDQVPTGRFDSLAVSMILKGEEKRTYDVTMTLVRESFLRWLDTKLKMRFFHEVKGSRHDNAHATCLDAQFDRPNFLPLASIDEVLKTNFTSTLKSEIYDGINCDGSPIVEMKANFGVTDEQKQKIKKDQKVCGRKTTPTSMDSITSQLYDEADLDIQITEDIPAPWKKMTERYLKVLKDWISSTGTLDSIFENLYQPHKFHAKRDPTTNLWTLRSKPATEDHLFSEFSLPPILGFPESTSDAILQRVVNGGNPSVCSITNEKVHTFDGESFQFTPNNCWKLAALENLVHGYVILVRYTGEWEVKVLWRDRGMAFELTRSQFKVQDTDVPAIAMTHKAIKLDNAMLLSLANGVHVKVSDKVELKTTIASRSLMVGMCGTYDGETNFELLGPKNCLYHDHHLFADAWETNNEESCDNTTYEERKQKVEAYQQDCPKRDFVSTGISHKNAQDQCISWEYQERKDGHCECKAVVPTPTCSSNCFSNDTVRELIDFDCRVEEGYSGKLSRCFPRSFHTSLPLGCKVKKHGS